MSKAMSLPSDSNMAPWAATVLTLFPEAFPGVLSVSLIGKAQKDGRFSLEIVDIRDFAVDRHRTVDGPPAGGGVGMILRADVAAKAVDAVRQADAQKGRARPCLYMSPRGLPLTQLRVRELSAGSGVILLCGRFEGVDERLLEARAVEEVSLADVILAGGEVAAQALIEASVRLLPGVMGDESSALEESFTADLLEYPHYTKPNSWEGRDIPPVLLSGDHAKIAAFRRAAAEKLTKLRRPDLYARHERADKPAREPGKREKD
jgi:tRNA (guanine37-N1)-methyltransferase